VPDFRIRSDAPTDPEDREQVWWEVIAPAFDELRTPYEPDPRLDDLTPGQRALYALYWARSEIDNGGFHQYLYNPTGRLANEALRGAELIGATEFATLFREVRTLLFGDTFPQDQGRRTVVLEGLSEEALERLEVLTGRFYDLMGSTDESRLSVYCAEYVEAHPQEFFRPDRP
jgi:Domain of unknown function (DUF4375)